jgi:hypothetical protein
MEAFMHLFRIIALASAVLAFGCTVTWSQDAGTANRTMRAYSGQTWVGLLVSASCPAPSKATDQSDMTITDRVTTPAVDASGTRGESTALDTREQPGTRTSLPATGDVLGSKAKSESDNAWKKAKRQASSLKPVCRVDANTPHFALLLPDGGMLHFADEADAAILKQLPAESKSTIYRVQVAGKLENGRIALDSIQM